MKTSKKETSKEIGIAILGIILAFAIGLTTAHYLHSMQWNNKSFHQKEMDKISKYAKEKQKLDSMEFANQMWAIENIKTSK